MKIRWVLLFCFAAWQATAQHTISDEWYGKWTGQMEIIALGRANVTLPVSLEIAPADSGWRYVITYNAGTDKPDRRDYQLIAIDAAKGHYAIDEKNGIILDSYLLGNCLFTSFAVMENNIVSRVCIEGTDTLHYEIISGKATPVRISGGQQQGAAVPTVNSYALFNRMKAILRREK